MDEFCDQAIEDRGAGAPRPAPRADRQGPAAVGRCVFCRGFADAGGCFGTVELLNRAVLDGRWEAARSLASEYLGRLRTLRFLPQPAGRGKTS
jgi:hypothetical protein